MEFSGLCILGTRVVAGLILFASRWSIRGGIRTAPGGLGSSGDLAVTLSRQVWYMNAGAIVDQANEEGVTPLSTVRE